MTSITIKEYFAVEGSRLSNADARKIGPVLHALSEEGAVTARDVVDAARSTNSPLHSYFEWDNKVAADLWRVETARKILQAVKVKFIEPDGETRVARAFQVVRERAWETAPRAYRTFQVLHGDSAFAAQMMDSAIDDLQSWRRKYEPYIGMWKSFGDVFQSVLNQIDEFETEIKTDNALAETDDALAKLLIWREECADVLALWTASREQVEFIMQSIREAEALFSKVSEVKERNCLKCRKPFRSVSIGNRICKTCLNAKTINERGGASLPAMSWDSQATP